MDPVDALILAEAEGVAPRAHRVVTIDDATGELTRAAVAAEDVAAYADSLAAEQDLASTLAARGRPDPTLAERGRPRPSRSPLHSLDAHTLAGVDLVLMRLPKSLAALDEYAGLVATHADPDVRVVAGGRVKHMTRGMNEVLARHFSEVRASLGVRKARVLHAASPIPGQGQSWPQRQEHADHGLVLCAHGACFGGTKIDPGTRLLLDALRSSLGGTRTGDETRSLDLGSGNGTLTVALARLGFRVTAIDESRAAVRSTAATAAANGVEVEVRRADGLADTPDASVDLIACNPPFHLGTAKDSSVALAMIADAGRVLAPGGELWLVWNAHLPYLPALRRAVGPTDIVARNPKFIVTRSRRG
ncbi:class I SAM-dependent methyltransferase [Mariniluteicoccus flavus]